MPKTKNRKYARVKQLSNVILGEKEGGIYPWTLEPWASGRKILELGCGKGEHSIGFALDQPETLCIGVDIKSHRLCDAGERGGTLGLGNLMFLRAHIGHLHDFFKEGSVDEIWITFPDPHPKQREIKHRLTAPGFLASYARLLRPGGMVHLKTDSDLLFTYTRENVDYWGGRILFENRALESSDIPCAGAAHIVSTFEAKARKRGKTIKYLGFRLN